MLNSVVKRQRMMSPLSEVEKKIIRSATKLFLSNGFSGTTLKMISEDTGLRQGNISYHFHTKEDMLYLLIQELMDSHADIVEGSAAKLKDELLAYCIEVTPHVIIDVVVTSETEGSAELQLINPLYVLKEVLTLEVPSTRD